MKPCWCGGSFTSNGGIQSKTSFNINRSLKDSENGSSKGQSVESFSAEDELKDSDVQVHLIMHHGIPTTCWRLAYDPVQHMLALATKDGHIKVFSDSGLESNLQPSTQCAIQFLQIFNDQSLLVCVNLENVIEVWDVSTSSLIGSQKWNENITALGVIQDSTYFFIGDASGTVTVIQHDREQLEVNATAYIITVPQVFGDLSKDHNEKLSVKDILPQPNCEHKRVLICYANGVCVLWELHDGEVIAVRAHTASALVSFLDLEQGDNSANQLPADKTLTSICWCCGEGVKFATGYNDGDIWIWSIDQTTETMLKSDCLGHDSFNCSSTPLRKLKTGSLVPINVLRWWEKEDHRQEKEGFLCALGGKTANANDVLKVISVNDACLLRSEYSIDLEVPEQLADCIPVHSTTWLTSEAKFMIMVLGSEGRLYTYSMKNSFQSINSSIHTEKLSVIRPVSVDFRLSKSQVTKTKLVFLRKHGRVSDYIMQMPRVFKPCLCFQNLEFNKMGLPHGCKQTEYSTDLESEGCYLYITGHEDGLVYFWDLSSQIMSICGPQFQGNTDRESVLPMGDCAVSSLDFCSRNGLLVVGYANGLISLHSLNLDNDKSYRARLTDEGKEGPCALWFFVSKFHTHKAPVSCVVISSSLHRIASGCENGIISLFDIETKAILFSGSCFPNKASRIMSLNFVSVPEEHKTYSCWGSAVPSTSKKKPMVVKRMELILVTTKDAGVFALDGEIGAFLKTSPFKLKNLSNAISLHLLDASNPSLDMPSECHNELLPQKRVTAITGQTARPVENEINGDAVTTRNKKRQYLLLCSENALHVYNMPSSLNDVCSSLVNVKLDSPCQWAYTFQTTNRRTGLILLYKTGKIEIRCLPSLNLVKSIFREGFPNRKIEHTLSSLRHIACTSNGHIALVKNDGEILVLSVLDAKHDVRGSKLLPVSSEAVKKKTGTSTDLGIVKKKKSLRKVIKATNVLLRISDKGNKVTSQKVVDLDQLFTGKSSSTTRSLQSSHQYNDESHSGSSSALDVSSQSLDIDDIDIDDEDAPKDGATTPNHIKLTSKVQKNMKGKVKSRDRDLSKLKSHRGDQGQKSDGELSPVHGPRTIAEIKAAYKQGKDPSVMGTAAELRDRLIQRRHKIGEVERKTADMQEGARQFHKMAEELCKAMEEKNKRKFF